MYAFSTTVDGPFEDAIGRVTEALKAEGFGVLTEIDVKATLKNKLDVDQPPYTILGACNPSLAHRALEVEPDVGVLLPCNVVVRAADGGRVTVTFMDPEAVLKLVEAPEVGALAREVRERLDRVRAALQ